MTDTNDTDAISYICPGCGGSRPGEQASCGLPECLGYARGVSDCAITFAKLVGVAELIRMPEDPFGGCASCDSARDRNGIIKHDDDCRWCNLQSVLEGLPEMDGGS